MDSFYDAPRRAPVPTQVEQFLPTPVVPEVSIICQSRTHASPCPPYSHWRAQQSTNILTSNPPPSYASQLLKKQVRFESPVLQQRPSLTYEPFNSRSNDVEDGKRNIPSLQEIYMANFSNKQLDLSLVEAPGKPLEKVQVTETTAQSEDKENMLPKTYREFLETQKKIVKRDSNRNPNDSITDILNYKRSVNDCVLRDKKPNEVPMESKVTKPAVFDRPVVSQVQRIDKSNGSSSSNFPEATKADRVTQTSVTDTSLQPVKVKEFDSAEPTNRDLLKIIAQQNEQLLLLQKQVALLLNRDNQQVKPIEAPPHCQNCQGDKCVTSTQNELFRNPDTPRKRGVSKFSIDLMTSFEVAVRPQHSKQNFARIEEVAESTGVDKTVVDTSLCLQEPVKVREMCPSPEPSININMNDYDSSEDDETASEIGATFYRNLMGQVNNILRKAQVQTKEDTQDCTGSFKSHTMDRVKEATLKHLRNIGVTIGPIEEVEEEVISKSNDKDYSPTEISFAVKQLLMKYLPDEHLARVTCKPPASTPGRPGIIPNRPEFSFASVEYMKKYNLISSNRNNKAVDTRKPDAQKILDITALKMQPKLL